MAGMRSSQNHILFVTGPVEFMRGMDQQRHVFADSIRKLAQDKDRTEDLIKRISLIVGRAFVENLLAVIGR
jgi:hypothetical protein